MNVDPARAFNPVAVCDRSGFDESFHFGAVVALAADGEIAHAIGDPEVKIYARSACKPLQADAMIRLGLQLDEEGLALACASHDGTDRHIAVARRTLAGAGLGEEALRNTADLPFDRATAEHLLAGGGRRDPVHMNCSGKHAAMVATCALNGWDVATYLDSEHPLQLALTAHVSDLTGGVHHIGIDGCGAPAHAVSLRGLAHAFRTLAMERGPVFRAMVSHPDLVGGERRDVTRLMRAVPDLMAKDGAEGVFAAALPDGRAAAIKISDGSARAAGVVIAAALRAVGVDVDPAGLGEPILGHDVAVGTVRPIAPDVS